jgi:hypothetical protein
MHKQEPLISFEPYSDVLPEYFYRADWAGRTTFDLNDPSNCHHGFGCIYVTRTREEAERYARARTFWPSRNGRDASVYQLQLHALPHFARFENEGAVLGASERPSAVVEQKYRATVERLRRAGCNGFVNMALMEIAIFPEVRLSIEGEILIT